MPGLRATHKLGVTLVKLLDLSDPHLESRGTITQPSEPGRGVEEGVQAKGLQHAGKVQRLNSPKRLLEPYGHTLIETKSRCYNSSCDGQGNGSSERVRHLPKVTQ